MGRPIVLHDLGMVDREIRYWLLEVICGIAAVAHHLLNQLITVLDRLDGMVDEPLLNEPPGLRIASASIQGEIPDLEPQATLRALAQLRLP
jgi:hypothetical protein